MGAVTARSTRSAICALYRWFDSRTEQILVGLTGSCFGYFHASLLIALFQKQNVLIERIIFTYIGALINAHISPTSTKLRLNNVNNKFYSNVM